MSEIMLMNIVKESILVSLKIAGPMLVTAVIIGVIISILQATTQIQEQTLTFVPKLLGLAAVGLLTGTFMLRTIVSFTTRIFEIISAM